MPSDESDRPVNRERDEPFLKRWSRRKGAAERPDAAGAPAATPETDHEGSPPETAGGEAPPTESAEAAAGTEAAPIDEELPDPETLDRDSDFSAYLSERVSSRLRRAAMRRLFSSPEFNVRDGLDDYDEDYTQFKSLGETVTAHMRYHQERLRRRDEEAEEARTHAEHEQAGERPDADRAGEPAEDRDTDHDTDHETQTHTAADDMRRAHERDDDDNT